MLFAVGGMLLFPASNDLLMMFVALEVLSLPLYLMCGLARRRRLLSQEAAMKYFLLGAFSSAFFLYGSRCSTATPTPSTCPASPTPSRTSRQSDVLLFAGLALLGVGLLFKVGAAPVPQLDAGRLPGRADPDHRLHGRVHQGRRVRRAAAGALRGLRRRGLGLAAGDLGGGDLTMVVGACSR